MADFYNCSTTIPYAPEVADRARRCIDRNIPDLPDRVTVAQALGLLPDTGRARSHGEPGRTVAREATG